MPISYTVFLTVTDCSISLFPTNFYVAATFAKIKTFELCSFSPRCALEFDLFFGISATIGMVIWTLSIYHFGIVSMTIICQNIGENTIFVVIFSTKTVYQICPQIICFFFGEMIFPHMNSIHLSCVYYGSYSITFGRFFASQRFR